MANFKIDVYGKKVHVFKKNEIEKAEKILNYNIQDLDISDINAITIFSGHKCGVVFFEDATPELIAHESVHIACRLFNNICADVDTINDEPFAYLVGYIVKKISAITNNQ